ncbi:glycine-rich domain-containing protein [Actinokineospora cianjurensis]|uniref:Uncharacterized protein n=1 Tax=Actinokineospora cianjurensis TaxID=585224 RepID=A0A421B867_9PSEU|nr:hypothetical protein [Actinokineospora cianjurensis]RLK60567.1 hypothetical protein CLV68_1076 [Actinokineospora cianjurensis]
MTVVMSEHATGRSLVSEGLFDRLARRVVAEEGVDRAMAERIVDQALAFVAVCGSNSAMPLSPSAAVDIGWHAFILHTKEYADFCDRVAGRFVHHVPTAEEDRGTRGEAARATLVRTVEAVGRRYVIDAQLWPLTDIGCQKCTGCHNGCHDDPPPPPGA